MSSRGGKKEETLEKLVGLFEPVITVQALVGGKTVVVLPPEIGGYASMPE